MDTRINTTAATDTFGLDTTQTLDELFHQILNQALVLAGAQSGSLMLVDPTAKLLQIKARLGKPRAGRRTEVIFALDHPGNAAYAARTGRARIVTDTQRASGDEFTRTRPGQETIRSLLSVPVLDQQRVIAVINADSDQPNAFTPAHQAALEAFARTIGPLIANRPSVVDAVVAIGLELAQVSGEAGVKPVLSKIARVAVQSLGADIVTLYEYDQAHDRFLVEGTGPTIEGELHHYEAMKTQVHPQDAPWIMVHQQRTIPASFYVNVQEQSFLATPRQDGLNRQRFTDREQIRSMAALLLPQRAATDPDQEIVGVLFVNYRQIHSFNSDERRLLAAFADYAAIAIQNARAQRQQRARQQRIVSIISAFPASFAASIHSFAGTSRVTTQIMRERIARDHLADRDGFIERQLARIARESELLYGLAARISGELTSILQSTQLASVDLPQLIGQARRALDQDESAAGVTITTDLAPDLPRVLSVDTVLLRVLQDLLKNALAATAGQDARSITVVASLDTRRKLVRITVDDNGRGVSPAIRASLFEQILTRQGGGGLSLWYDSLFMQSTGGDLRLAEPQPAVGASFVLEIPCATDINALVMSVDPQRRQMIADVVQSVASRELPCEIEQLATYAEAAQWLARHRTELVLLDYQTLPDWPGVQAVLAACQAREHAPRVLLIGEQAPAASAGEWSTCLLESPELFEMVRRSLH